MKIFMINGSLSGKKATSLTLLDILDKRLNAAGYTAERMGVKAGTGPDYPQEIFRRLYEADVIVLVFPLFTYSLPGALIRFLEEFDAYAKTAGSTSRGARLYGIVNSGFPDAKVCTEAIRVLRNFGARQGMVYRFSIAISCGPVTVKTMKVPFLNPGLKHTLNTMVRDIINPEPSEVWDRYFDPIIPKLILLRIKDHYEKNILQGARKNAASVNARQSP